MNIRMQYIGACSLLARLAVQIDSEDDLESIHQVLDDCAASFPGEFEVIETSGGGFSLEPISGA